MEYLIVKMEVMKILKNARESKIEFGHKGTKTAPTGNVKNQKVTKLKNNCCVMQTFSCKLRLPHFTFLVRNKKKTTKHKT